MNRIKSHIARNVRKAGLIAALCTTAATLATAVPAAQAQPIGNGGGTTKGCPVEDEHGNVTYVPEGTRVGLFHCGSDGEWHFGWLTNALIGRNGHPITVSGAGSARASGVR